MPQILVTNASTSVPVQIATTVKNAQWVTFIACKGLGGPTASPNSGKIQIGFSPTASQQPVELAPGATFQMFVASSAMMDLSQFYLAVASANDGVVLFYI